MEKELTIVLIVLLILFIIYMIIQKTDVCSIVRNEREEFNVGAEWTRNKTLGAIGTGLFLTAGGAALAAKKLKNTSIIEKFKIEKNELIKLLNKMGNIILNWEWELSENDLKIDFLLEKNYGFAGSLPKLLNKSNPIFSIMMHREEKHEDYVDRVDWTLYNTVGISGGEWRRFGRYSNKDFNETEWNNLSKKYGDILQNMINILKSVPVLNEEKQAEVKEACKASVTDDSSTCIANTPITELIRSLKFPSEKDEGAAMVSLVKSINNIDDKIKEIKENILEKMKTPDFIKENFDNIALLIKKFRVLAFKSKQLINLNDLLNAANSDINQYPDSYVSDKVQKFFQTV